MLKIKQKFGAIDGTPNLPADKLALELAAFRADSEIQGLKAGRVAYIDSNGEVALAANAQADRIGFIVNDAAGYEFENVPGHGSGKCPLVFGGGIFETDQVIQDDVTYDDPLYIGANGQLTTVNSGSDTVVAYARSENSAADKTIEILAL